MIHRLVIPGSIFLAAFAMLAEPKLAQEEEEQLPVIINELRAWQDDSLVLAMEGGISISEDTNIRFTYVPNGRKARPRRGKEHRAPSVPERMEGRRFRLLTGRRRLNW
jgi:hypothetical protein